MNSRDLESPAVPARPATGASLGIEAAGSIGESVQTPCPVRREPGRYSFGGLLRYVVTSLSPEALAREDREALRWRMALSDWIELRAAGLRGQVPAYVEYEVTHFFHGGRSFSVRSSGEFPAAEGRR